MGGFTTWFHALDVRFLSDDEQLIEKPTGRLSSETKKGSFVMDDF